MERNYKHYTAVTVAAATAFSVQLVVNKNWSASFQILQEATKNMSLPSKRCRMASSCWFFNFHPSFIITQNTKDTASSNLPANAAILVQWTKTENTPSNISSLYPQIPRNPGGTQHVQSVYQYQAFFFSSSPVKSERAWIQGYVRVWSIILISAYLRLSLGLYCPGPSVFLWPHSQLHIPCQLNNACNAQPSL